MKVWTTILATFALVASASAADLFSNNQLRDISPGTLVTAEDTIGGYAIYPGEGKWKFVKAQVGTSTGAATIGMGAAFMNQWEDGEIFAAYAVKANLGNGSISYWTGSPCDPNHLVMVNKVRGRDDNCLTIDPTAVSFGGPAKTMLMIRSTLTGGNARFYYSELLFNPEFLGAWDTTVADWSAAALQENPQRKNLIERLSQWAQQFHDRATQAYALSKPQGVYADLPPVRSIVPVPEALLNGKHSLAFLGAIEDLRHQSKPAAIAYFQVSDYRTRWGRTVDAPTQAEANQSALAKCEKLRTSSAPPCVLYH